MLSRSFLAARCTRLLSRTYASQPSGRGPNHPIIDMLTKDMQEEDASPTRNGFKVRAFASAIKAIAQLPQSLHSAAEATSLKGVGAGIARRIELFLDCGPESHDEASICERKREESERRRVIAELRVVPGVGLRKAEELIAMGCRSLADLRQHTKYTDLLTSSQKIGLRYCDHLTHEVSRNEVETVAAFIRDNISNKFEVQVVGSYRRGTTTSQDISIALFHPTHVHVPTPAIPFPSSSPTSSTSVLDSATKLSERRGRRTHPFRSPYTSASAHASSPLLACIESLKERGLLAATFANGERKWRGVIRLPDRLCTKLNGRLGENVGSGEREMVWGERGERLRAIRAGEGVYRRLDLNLVPLKSRGAALLSLTGDAAFVKDLRARAVTLGLYLDEFGLWQWREGGGGDDGNLGEEARANGVTEKGSGYWALVRAECEADVLDALGMPYVEPERRNFTFLRDVNGRARGRPKKV